MVAMSYTMRAMSVQVQGERHYYLIYIDYICAVQLVEGLLLAL